MRLPCSQIDAEMPDLPGIGSPSRLMHATPPNESDKLQVPSMDVSIASGNDATSVSGVNIDTLTEDDYESSELSLAYSLVEAEQHRRQNGQDGLDPNSNSASPFSFRSHYPTSSPSAMGTPSSKPISSSSRPQTPIQQERDFTDIETNQYEYNSENEITEKSIPIEHLKSLRIKHKSPDKSSAAVQRGYLLASSTATSTVPLTFNATIAASSSYPQIIFSDISVHVTGVQHSKKHAHGLRHKLFRIELLYQHRIRWTILRGPNDLVRLHGKLLLKRLKGRVEHVPALPSSLFWSFRRMYERAYDKAVHVARQISAYSLTLPASGAGRHSQEGDSRQYHDLEEYLLSLFQQTASACEKEICTFLECSSFTLNSDDDLGENGQSGPQYFEKLKEGYVWKLAGGRQKPSSSILGCIRLPSLRKRSTLKWLVIGDDYVTYLSSPHESRINDVLLCDASFDVRDGKEVIEFPNGLRVANGYRTLDIRTRSKHQRDEWMKELLRLKRDCLWVVQHDHMSFAPVRENVSVAGYIDGRQYLRDVATALDLAKHQIFIADWWLSPYLHLARDPCDDYLRLDTILKRKAEAGVKIYVIVYKEMNLAFANNSRHTKKVLQTLHPSNVCVLRYPDHTGPNLIWKWAHHEKLVIVDQSIAFLGGLDLCYGRDDTPQHVLTDIADAKHPNGRFWPGQDYSNPRLANVTRVDNPAYSSVNREQFPRMPWHDISCVVTGAGARDFARHFIQRWNFIKNVKAKAKPSIHFLIPFRELNVSARSRHERGSELSNVDSDPDRNNGSISKAHDDKNSGVGEVTGAIACGENSRVIESYSQSAIDALGQAQGNSARHISSPGQRDDSQYLAVPADILITHDSSMSSEESTHDNLTTASVGSVSYNEPEIIREFFQRCTANISFAPRCRVQAVRSAGTWSNGTSPETSIHTAYVKLIQDSKFFLYIENQFFISFADETAFVENQIARALVERIKKASAEKQSFRVVFLLPSLPGFQGDLDDMNAGTLRAITYWQYRSIRHLIGQLEKEKLRPADFVEFFTLRNHGFLAGRHVTEQVYIHSKMMMADDQVAIIGSANINDRSLIGIRDSEVALRIEDTELVDSLMAGKPWKASKFCLQMRMKLTREHLGDETLSDDLLLDPLSNDFYHNVWRYHAFHNTAIYRDCFRCIPDDAVESWTDYAAFKRSKRAYAIQEMESKLAHIKGHLVLYPTRFLQRENLGEGFSKDLFT